MTRLGITGHQAIPKAAYDFVSQGLHAEIARASRNGALWGVTSLAVGADQLFAESVLIAGGRLHVIVPSAGYEAAFDARGLRRFNVLLAAAAEVEHLEFEKPTEEAFLAAGKRVVDLCDRLLAVWDGEPSRGLGGTADVVDYARSAGRSVDIIWPAGIAR